MDLNGGQIEASKIDCSASPESFCLEFKNILMDKIDSKKGFISNKCDNSNYPKGLDLMGAGQAGCLILQPFVRVDLETLEKGGRNICPKLIWVNGSKATSIYVEPKKNQSVYSK